jgi:hypothetical protein
MKSFVTVRKVTQHVLQSMAGLLFRKGQSHEKVVDMRSRDLKTSSCSLLRPYLIDYFMGLSL